MTKLSQVTRDRGSANENLNYIGEPSPSMFIMRALMSKQFSDAVTRGTGVL